MQPDDKKTTQPGKGTQPEIKKSHEQKPSEGQKETSGLQGPAANQEQKPVVEAQKPRTPEEAQRLIDELTAKLAEKMAANPTPDAKKIAQEAIKKVHEARAREMAERQANPPTTTGTTPSGKVDRWPDRQKKSQISNPVQFVWSLAEEMTKADPTARRKDIIEAAIDAGVAGYTARTQYQAWYTAKRETARQQAKRDADALLKSQQTGTGR